MVRIALAAVVLVASCGRVGFDAVSLGAIELSHVESGIAIIPDGETATAAPISAVDTERAFVVFGVEVSSDQPNDALIVAQLGATQLELEREGTDGPAIIRYYVVSFESGVRVQRGALDVVETAIAPLSGVDRARTFPLAAFASGGNDFNEDDLPRVELVDARTLAIARSDPLEGGAALTWQVVELADAHVQHIQTAMRVGELEVTVPVGTDPASSWLVYSYRFTDDTSTIDEIADRMVEGSLEPGAARFARRLATGTIDLQLSLVEVPGARVEAGSTTFPLGTGTVMVPIQPVDPLRTFVMGGAAGHFGSTTLATTDVVGDAMFSFELVDTTTLVIRRGSIAGDASASWFVVEL